MVSEKTRQFIDMIKELNQKEFKDVEHELCEEVGKTDDYELINTYYIIRNIIEKINTGNVAQEVVREGINEAVKSSYKNKNLFQQTSYNLDSDDVLTETKQKEIRDILDNLDEYIQGDSIEDATNAFSSMLDILSQFCMKRTQGVISIRAKLDEFFSLDGQGGSLNRIHQREISMMFSPEEILAIQIRITDMKEDDPMGRFFTAILDQAFDVVRFNELSGNLLLFMSQYFIDKMVGAGYRDSVALINFQSRHNRSKMAMSKSIEALFEGERTVNRHLREKPVLKELPKYLRGLINIKIGLASPDHTQDYLTKVRRVLDEYSRARSAVAFDFNLLPALQHDVRVKHGTILNLQKDLMEFMTKAQENELKIVEDSLVRIMDEIETNSQNLKPGSFEYEEVMRKKLMIQKRVEESRRRLDVLRCQQKMVNVQQTMLTETMKRYKDHEEMLNKTLEKLHTHKIKLKPKTIISPKKNKMTGMVNQKKPNR